MPEAEFDVALEQAFRRIHRLQNLVFFGVMSVIVVVAYLSLHGADPVHRVAGALMWGLGVSGIGAAVFAKLGGTQCIADYAMGVVFREYAAAYLRDHRIA